MSFIRTVLSDIAPPELGVCYAHEHIIIDPSYTSEVFPEFALPDVERAVAELREFHASSGRAMIDTMPCGAGRNVLKLAEVSRRTGVHIVCPTGLHLAKYYPLGHWGERLSAEELAELFVADIEIGVDANDYSGPEVRRTEHRAGVIKVAGGRDALSEHERKVFRAAAMASVRTNCPIITHTEQGTAALEQVRLLVDGGVAPRHIVLSHTDRQPDYAYHREILSTGVCVEYDSAFRWKTSENPTTLLIAALLPEFPEQIMVGMDAARPTYWKSYGGAPGLTFLLREYIPALFDAGLDEDALERLFVINPAKTYAFE
jgi:predicted metal-dependent phosphotriesterase family hydrolase